MLFFQLDSVREQYRANKIKMLAVTTPRRLASVPEVPTMEEAGVKGFRSDTWHALAAPPKTPAAIIAKLNGGINAVLAEPDGGALAGHEHDAGRRHARGGEGLHQAGSGALGRGDPRRKDQRGLGRVHSRNVRSHCSDQ
jgi:tripartite-type tricarboxylate transporter receptor subunit TctC